VALERFVQESEAIVTDCEHEVIEWQARDHGMHVVGWMCRWCSGGQAVDYHYETACHRSYCGADPIIGDEHRFRLSSEEFRIELERIVYRALRRRSSSE
jgi:hypothetical protein